MESFEVAVNGVKRLRGLKSRMMDGYREAGEEGLSSCLPNCRPSLGF